MTIYQKIRHEFTKERHNDFIDGFLDFPTSVIYGMVGKEDKLMLRAKNMEGHEEMSPENTAYRMGELLSIPVKLLFSIPALAVAAYRMTKEEPEITIFYPNEQIAKEAREREPEITVYRFDK